MARRYCIQGSIKLRQSAARSVAPAYGVLPHRVADFVQLHDELCPLRCFRLGFGLEAAQLCTRIISVHRLDPHSALAGERTNWQISDRRRGSAT